MNNYHRRQVQIAEVLSRRGMGYLLEELGLGGLVSLERRLLHRDKMHTGPSDLRQTLEELGPTFIKLGQFFSTRADIIPPEYQVELSKLQDYAPAIPSDVVEEIVSAELQTSSSAIFATFQIVPLACASIGQAHLARLQDGTEVVVKVRRPNVVEEVEQDLEILHNLAVRAARRWEEAARCDVEGLVNEFARILRAELDYLQEAGNAERFATNFGSDADIHVPRVFREFTTSRVITLERINGVKITDLAALDAAGMDRRALAERATRIVAKSVFEDGFFHGDPHPGNLFIESGGRIGVIDFGRMGVVDDTLRVQLQRLLKALFRRDLDRLTTALVDLGAPSGHVDRLRMRQDLAALLAQLSAEALGGSTVGSVFRGIQEIVRRHRLRMPHDLTVLFTVIVMEEGIAKTLLPDFRLDEALASYVERQLAHELSPSAMAQRVEQFGIDVAELAVDLPAQIHRLLDVLGEGGGLDLHLRAAELESLVERGEHLGNRIVASILAAAFIDGLSGLAAQAVRGHSWRRPAIAGGVTLVAYLSGYTVWRRSPAAKVLERFRQSDA